jgi:hypothetical protein
MKITGKKWSNVLLDYICYLIIDILSLQQDPSLSWVNQPWLNLENPSS